ncbi:MAG TPA: hypothetical protein VGL26_02295 [Jatrophihabitans sp.]
MTQHLSDEAVAAFADGVLRGRVRERAAKHTAECPECAYAVAVQREAIWMLRAAPAPEFPVSLIERLREVPETTELPSAPGVGPAAVDHEGSALFAAFGTRAAFLPWRREKHDSTSDQ